ncbi:MAG: PaaI family thioesterase [Actinomycetes bacterium]
MTTADSNTGSDSTPEIPEEHFDATLGLEVLGATPDLVTARVPVEQKIRQPFGIVHGGVYCSIAEAVASIGTWLGVRDDGKIAMGLANQTSFLRPISSGFIHASATPCHTGRTTWVWDVEMKDDEGRLAAVSRMTIAVRDLPTS